MKHTASFSQYSVDTGASNAADDLTPMSRQNRPVSLKKWWTPWHDRVDIDGKLAEYGRIRVSLRDDQFMIDRFNTQWKPISSHRDCESLLRVLGEKSRAKANAHLADDYLEVRRKLEAL